MLYTCREVVLGCYDDLNLPGARCLPPSCSILSRGHLLQDDNPSIKVSFTARDGWMMLGRTQDILQFLIQLELNGVEKLWLVPADLWWSPGGGWKCTLAGIGTARERLGSWIIEVCLVIYHSDGWVVPLTTCWSWYIYMKYGKIEIPLTKYT